MLVQSVREGKREVGTDRTWGGRAGSEWTDRTSVRQHSY